MPEKIVEPVTVIESAMNTNEITSMLKHEESEKDANNLGRSVGASEGFQQILLRVGNYGRWQKKVSVVASFCGVFTAFQNLSAGKSC